MLKAVLNAEEFEGLDPKLQAEYKQVGEDYHLDVQGIEVHPSTQGLRRTLEKYRELGTDATKLKKRLESADALTAKLEELGVDLEEVEERLARLQEIEDKGGEVDKDHKKELERQKEALERAHTKALEQKDSAIADLQAQIAEQGAFIESLVVDQQLDEAFAKHKVIEELRPAVRALIKTSKRPRAVKQEVEEGEEPVWRGMVVTDLGDVTIAEFMDRWVAEKDNGHYLEPSGNEGSGAGSGRPPRGGRTKSNPWKRETLNLTEQGRILKENPALAAQLKQQAGVP